MTDDRMLGYGEQSLRRMSRIRGIKHVLADLAPGMIGGGIGAIFVFVISGGALPASRMALTAVLTGVIFFRVHRLLQTRGYR
jgi:hypothetical protein